MKTILVVPLATLLAAGPALASLPSIHPADPRPIPVIDMHTHVFNALDVPLGGILIAQTAPRVVAEEVDKFFQSEDNRRAVDASEEKFLARRPGIPLGVPRIKSLPADDRSVLARTITLTATQRKVFADYLGQAKWGEGLRKAQVEGLPDALVTVANVLIQAGFMAGHPEKSRLAKNTETVERNMVDFVWLMLHRHRSIYHTLRAEYPAADLFVHHMMDMARGYDWTPWRDFPDQLTAMRDLDRNAGGRLLHFTAFDPFRRKQAQGLVDAGLKELAVGAKIYPPTGYKARGNTAFPPRIGNPLVLAQWDARYDGWTPAELDRTLLDFFQWSAKQNDGAGLPLFTHCTPIGFEAVPGYGLMADPEHWEKVLEIVPTLRLAFGHAGGEAYWFSTQDYADTDQSAEARSWRFGRKVVELCQRYPNVYCEVGYLEQVLDPDSQSPAVKALRQRLAGVLDKTGPGKFRFGDKLMYGTDWHMLYKEDNAPGYLAAFDRVISSIDQGRWRRKFFAGNAVEFLQLDRLAKDPRFAGQRQHWETILANAK